MDNNTRFLTDVDKRQFAKEFTLKALESVLIVKSASSVITAKELANFYNTLVSSLDPETTE